jgi:toxin FitB
VDYLVDINVLSELADPGVIEWAARVRRLSISAVTLEEIEFGLAVRSKARVRAWLEDFMLRHCDVLPVSEAVARQAGALRGRLRADGHSRTQADMLIAATAAQHALTLVTRNTRDFEGCGIPTLNPFVK